MKFFIALDILALLAAGYAFLTGDKAGAWYMINISIGIGLAACIFGAIKARVHRG